MRSRAGVLPIAAACIALAVAACGGGTKAVHANGRLHGHRVEDLYGNLPTAGTPTGAGTITMGQLNGDTPTYILPIVPSANATAGTQMLIDQLYVPLFNIQVGGEMKINWATSGAERPTFSDGDRRVTIRLRPGFDWSDGTPVSARDVLFDIALLKAAVRENASNWANYTPGLFPDNLRSATAQGARTVVLTFKRAYNPAYLIGDQLDFALFPLPSREWDVTSAHGPHVSDWSRPAVAKRIYDHLNKAASSLSTLATDPLWRTVDGPFQLASFNTTNGSFALRANPRYTLSGRVRYRTLRVESFTSTDSQLNALKAGSIDIGVVDFSQLGQVPTLRRAGYDVFGYPNIGSFGFILNFHDATDHFDRIISQLYARQALSHLVDEPAYITGIFKGAASAAYGPLPSVPRTPYTPKTAGTPAYPYSIMAAIKLLKAHGWRVVPNGQTTCARPGSGPGQCGPGIPRGTPFKFQLQTIPAGETASAPLESEAFASSLRAAGITATIGTKTFNFQIANYDDANPADRKYENDWGMANWGEYGTSPYPTGETIFNTTGSQNMGGYSSATADRLINASLYGHSASAATRTNSFLAKDVPMLFLPCADVLDAVSRRVGGTSDSFLAMTQDVWYPQYWYLKKS
ncbi:MAG TPA: ABC transporter substrate-binding protein [Solirubrobacteraceae bacterium]|nr:ABC transporter substrate-binding protein [Solirubrobacteraceae bacterium]